MRNPGAAADPLTGPAKNSFALWLANATMTGPGRVVVWLAGVKMLGTSKVIEPGDVTTVVVAVLCDAEFVNAFACVPNGIKAVLGMRGDAVSVPAK
jgi:hypothetical protein